MLGAAFSLSLPSALLGLIAAFAAAQGGRQDLGSVLASNPNVSTYYELIHKYPDILLQLPNYSGVTIIAPSNEAFQKYQGWDDSNQTLVTNILEYHILQGTVATGAVVEGVPYFAATLLQNSSFTNVTGGQRLIINKQPGDLVVFTSGEGSRSTLLDGDMTFTGGLVQMVDTLLVPPKRLEPTCRDAYQALQAFLGALYQTDLIDAFASGKNVTIFAPWNTAFQLLSGALSGLSDADLRNVLAYHIIPGQVLFSTDLVNASTWATLANNSSSSSSSSPGGGGSSGAAKLTISVAGNNRYVDSAQVLQPDILIANGVVHMVGGVLNPSAASALPNPKLATQAPVFALTGSTATGTRVPVPFTTALPCTADCPITTGASATGNGTAGGRRSSTSASSFRSSSSRGVGAAVLPRCTGMVGAMGVVGVGMLAGVGVM